MTKCTQYRLYIFIFKVSCNICRDQIFTLFLVVKLCPNIIIAQTKPCKRAGSCFAAATSECARRETGWPIFCRGCHLVCPKHQHKQTSTVQDSHHAIITYGSRASTKESFNNSHRQRHAASILH